LEPSESCRSAIAVRTCASVWNVYPLTGSKLAIFQQAGGRRWRTECGDFCGDSQANSLLSGNRRCPGSKCEYPNWQRSLGHIGVQAGIPAKIARLRLGCVRHGFNVDHMTFNNMSVAGIRITNSCGYD
jgi:hypothetical protein